MSKNFSKHIASTYVTSGVGFSQVFVKHQMGLAIYGPCYNFKLENSFESKLT